MLKIAPMNTTEVKTKIIRQINLLNEEDFEKVYRQLLNVLKTTAVYKLSEEENDAISSALQVSEEEGTYSREEVITEAKRRFSNLKFK